MAFADLENKKIDFNLDELQFHFTLKTPALNIRKC